MNTESPAPATSSAALFDQHRYMNLTTFRRQGQPVTTPVWFAVHNDKLYVFTGQATGKLKRIRNNPAVEVAPSTGSGQSRGPRVAGYARILAEHEEQQADVLIMQKYGWQKQLMAFFNQFRKQIGSAAYIEITLDTPRPGTAQKA